MLNAKTQPEGNSHVMDIPQGSEKDIQRKVQVRFKAELERMDNAAEKDREIPKSKVSPKKSLTGWKHSKFAMLLLKCSHQRIANSYWNAYCQTVAADLLNHHRPPSLGTFPSNDDALLKLVISLRPRQISDPRDWRAEWELKWETICAVDEPSPAASLPGIEGAYFAEQQTEAPPQALVDAIYKMRIQPKQLHSTAFSFCRMATKFSEFLRKSKVRKGGLAKNSPARAVAPPSSRRSCSHGTKHLVLQKVAAMNELRAASVGSFAKEINLGNSTLRNCLRVLTEEGLLRAWNDVARKGSKRHKITAAGQKWLTNN